MKCPRRNLSCMLFSRLDSFSCVLWKKRGGESSFNFIHLNFKNIGLVKGEGKFIELLFFWCGLFLSLYWICYKTVSVLPFGFLTTRHVGYVRILASQPGSNPHSCTGGRSLNHWTARELTFSISSFLLIDMHLFNRSLYFSSSFCCSSICRLRSQLAYNISR